MKHLTLALVIFLLTACTPESTPPQPPAEAEILYHYWPSQEPAQITYEVIEEKAEAYQVQYPQIENLAGPHPLRQAVNQSYTQAIETFKSDANTFYSESDDALGTSASIPWDYTVEWLGGRHSSDIWSLAFLVYTYQGGAHGNSYTDTYNYSVPENRLLTLSDFFTTNDYLTLLNQYLKSELVAAKSERWQAANQEEPYDINKDSFLKDLTFDERNLGAWLLSERDGEIGFLFFFAPYEIGSYAEGAYEAFVPASTLETYLKEEYKEVFK